MFRNKTVQSSMARGRLSWFTGSDRLVQETEAYLNKLQSLFGHFEAQETQPEGPSGSKLHALKTSSSHESGVPREKVSMLCNLHEMSRCRRLRDTLLT